MARDLTLTAELLPNRLTAEVLPARLTAEIVDGGGEVILPVPQGAEYLLTEAGDRLLTEAGDLLILEAA